MVQLSGEAENILRKAASSDDGEIRNVPNDQGQVVLLVDGKSLVSDDAKPREVASWREGFKELTHHRLIERVSDSVYEVTKKGYEESDRLAKT